jgi:DNA-binding transcriptional LysR family regulator
MRIEPEQLRMLALVAAHGSLAGAAAELDLTPAAVTGQVARAERQWGVPLVVRSSRGARLTDAGESLAAHGREIDAVCELAESAMSGTLTRTSRRLRIGTFMSAALRVLPEAVTALRHRHPDSDLSIVEGTSPGLRERVAAGEVDVAVVGTYGEDPPLPSWLIATRLFRDPLVLCLPSDHRLAATPPTRRIRMSQLRADRWIAILAGEAARAQFDAAAASAGIEPTIQFETQSYDVAQALVATGLGVAVISQMAARAMPGTTHRELERPRLFRELWAVHARDTRLTPLVDEFVELVGQVCAELTDRLTEGPLGAVIAAQS